MTGFLVNSGDALSLLLPSQGVVHKIHLQQDWVGSFTKCQLYFMSLASKTDNWGGWVKKRQKYVNLACEASPELVHQRVKPSQAKL